MNISLLLTFTRLVASATLLPIFFLVAPWQSSFVWAILLDIFVALLCVTDFLDGRLARLLQIETAAGRVFDPVADKVLVAAMFLVLFAAGRVDLFLILLVIVREFMVMGLRELALMQGATVSVSLWGKGKTGVQMLFCLFQIINPRFYGIESMGFFAVEKLLWWLVVILTIKSALDYFQTFFLVTTKNRAE